jgi:hypothetical protein
MIGDLGTLIVTLLGVGAIFSTVVLILAHAGSRNLTFGFAVLVWLTFSLVAWLALPATLPFTPVGRVLAALLAPAPSVGIATLIITSGQWRPAPRAPRSDVVLGTIGFVLGSPFGLFAAMFGSEVGRH